MSSRFSQLGQQLTDYNTQQQQQGYQASLGGGQVGSHSMGMGGGGGQVGNQALGMSGGGGGQVGNQGMGMNGGVSLEALHVMSVLSSIQQNIGQLQAIVPHFSENQQLSNPLIQQNAFATIKQLAQVTANIFPLAAQQHLHNASGFQSILDSHLPQLNQQSAPPPFNLFPQNQAGGGSSNHSINSTGTTNGSGFGNNFTFPAQDGGGLNTGSGLSRLADQLGVDVGFGFQQQGAPAISGSKSSSAGVQSFLGTQEGNNVSAVNGAPASGKHHATTGPAAGVNHHGSSHGNSNHEQVAMGMIGGGGSQGISPRLSSHRSAQLSSGELMDSADVVQDEDEGEDNEGDGEALPPGSYDLVEMEPEEILAQHTHFCDICGKGFKRDANLRMHMRGHGDEYKSPAALRAPDNCKPVVVRPAPRRFSCPHVGCKRNKKHRRFQPLKTVLCVKNHYRRSHCPKTYECKKCKKKRFSVQADLKTHEKHCGCDKWECSCGTTFSRKDKLLGHVSLFVGHTPATFKPNGEMESTPGGLVNAGASGLSSGGTGVGLGGNMHGPSMGSGGLGNVLSKDGSMVGGENCGSSMLQGLFTVSSGGNSSSDCLH